MRKQKPRQLTLWEQPRRDWPPAVPVATSIAAAEAIREMGKRRVEG